LLLMRELAELRRIVGLNEAQKKGIRQRGEALSVLIGRGIARSRAKLAQAKAAKRERETIIAGQRQTCNATRGPLKSCEVNIRLDPVWGVAVCWRTRPGGGSERCVQPKG